MSNYKAGEIIKLSRIANGISQEELAMDVCSVETLSRIENGKHKVKRDTYQRLMAKMDRDMEKSYLVLTTEHIEVLEEDDKMRDAMARHDYELAETYLPRIKRNLDDTVLNHQYVKKTEAVIDFFLEKIEGKEFVLRLQDALKMTVPDYTKMMNKVYPYMEQEIIILMNLATAYSQIEEHEKGIEILEMLLKCLDADYMDVENAKQLEVMLIANLAKKYGAVGDHETAIKLSQKGIAICKDRKINHALPNLLCEIAWNTMQLIEQGKKEKEEKELCRKYLLEGYFLAGAGNMEFTQNVLKKYYKECFHEDIHLIVTSEIGESPHNFTL